MVDSVPTIVPFLFLFLAAPAAAAKGVSVAVNIPSFGA